MQKLHEVEVKILFLFPILLSIEPKSGHVYS